MSELLLGEDKYRFEGTRFSARLSRSPPYQDKFEEYIIRCGNVYASAP